MGEYLYALASVCANNAAANNRRDVYGDGLPGDIEPEEFNDLRRIFNPNIDVAPDRVVIEVPLTIEEQQRRYYLLFSMFYRYSVEDPPALYNNDPTIAPRGLYLDLCGSIEVVSDVDKNTKCPVCLDIYGNAKYLRKLSCDHKFHLKCGYEWMLRKTFCPMCHIKITLNPKTDEAVSVGQAL